LDKSDINTAWKLETLNFIAYIYKQEFGNQGSGESSSEPCSNSPSPKFRNNNYYAGSAAGESTNLLVAGENKNWGQRVKR